MFKWFKKYQQYHVSYVCAKDGGKHPTFSDQLVVTQKKIDGFFLQELRDRVRENQGYDQVVILNIIKL